MNALIIEKKIDKFERIGNAISTIILIGVSVYFTLSEAASDSYGLFFFTFAICGLFHLIKLLYTTLWARDKTILKIDNTIIESKVPGSKFKEEWVKVSKISIGLSYIIFFVDGGRKQRKLYLSELTYNDVPTVKGKLIELCEYKNIPYIKD